MSSEGCSRAWQLCCWASSSWGACFLRCSERSWGVGAGRPCSMDAAWLYARSTSSPLGQMAVSSGDTCVDAALALKAQVGCGRLPVSIASPDDAEACPPRSRGLHASPRSPAHRGAPLYSPTAVLPQKARVVGFFPPTLVRC